MAKFVAKSKKDPDESLEDPKEEATETKRQEAAEDAAEPDAPKRAAPKRGAPSPSERSAVSAIEKRKGPVGPGHHNEHRTQALLTWLRSKEASKK